MLWLSSDNRRPQVPRRIRPTTHQGIALKLNHISNTPFLPAHTATRHINMSKPQSAGTLYSLRHQAHAYRSFKPKSFNALLLDGYSRPRSTPPRRGAHDQREKS